jgi:hypothetical protein
MVEMPERDSEDARFVAAHLPNDPSSRKRVASALLRLIVAEQREAP